jgi:hypothetical protein
MLLVLLLRICDTALQQQTLLLIYKHVLSER